MPLMYYGITLETSSFSGDLSLNQFLGFVVEAPAILGTILAIGRVGRRSTASALLLEGAADALALCIIVVIVAEPDSMSYFSTASHLPSTSKCLVQCMQEGLHACCAESCGMGAKWRQQWPARQA